MKSVLTDENTCVVCGSENVEWHHIFAGIGRRRISDRYGYVIPLCADHHRGSDGIHFNKKMDVFFKGVAEMHFLEHHGTKEDFIKMFGKNYIMEDDE